MAWFAASVVMYFRLKDGPQDEFSIWENVYLIDAPDGAQAHAKAEALGKLGEGDDDGSLRLDGKPAEQVFGGVRKVLSCAPSLTGQAVDNSVVEDGMEATFSTFTVGSREDLEAFIRGESVQVIYEE
jgi:hypothetical protein